MRQITTTPATIEQQLLKSNTPASSPPRALSDSQKSEISSLRAQTGSRGSRATAADSVLRGSDGIVRTNKGKIASDFVDLERRGVVDDLRARELGFDSVSDFKAKQAEWAAKPRVPTAYEADLQKIQDRWDDQNIEKLVGLWERTLLEELPKATALREQQDKLVAARSKAKSERDLIIELLNNPDKARSSAYQLTADSPSRAVQLDATVRELDKAIADINASSQPIAYVDAIIRDAFALAAGTFRAVAPPAGQWAPFDYSTNGACPRDAANPIEPFNTNPAKLYCGAEYPQAAYVRRKAKFEARVTALTKGKVITPDGESTVPGAADVVDDAVAKAKSGGSSALLFAALAFLLLGELT